MRKIHLTAMVILSIVLLLSCEKARQRIVKGQIIDKVTKQPLSDTQFKLLVSTIQQNQLSKGSYAEYKFTTNSAGRFEVMFESKTREDLIITYPHLKRFENDIWELSSYDKKDLEIDAGVIEAEKQ